MIEVMMRDEDGIYILGLNAGPHQLRADATAGIEEQNIVVDLHADPRALPVWIRSRATGAQKRGANQLSYQGR